MVERQDQIPVMTVSAITAINKAGNIADLTDVFSGFVKALGLNTFQLTEVVDAHNFPGANLSFGTLPAEYIKEYWKRGGGGIHDPTMRTILTSNRPIRFLREDMEIPSQKPSQDVLHRRFSQGIVDGYAFPLKGRMNRFAMVAVHGDVSGFSSLDLVYIEMACLALYRRATDLHSISNAIEFSEKGVLTVRERECLAWVAKGKTNWDISQILRITERTVQYHIENAKKKLGADTRLQAVVLAARQLEIML